MGGEFAVRPEYRGVVSDVPRGRLATLAVHLPSRYRTTEETRAGIAASGEDAAEQLGRRLRDFLQETA